MNRERTLIIVKHPVGRQWNWRLIRKVIFYSMLCMGIWFMPWHVFWKLGVSNALAAIIFSPVPLTRT